MSARQMISVWCLTAVVLANSYISTLVSYITAPRFTPLINTVQDLADSHHLQIAILRFSATDFNLFVSKLDEARRRLSQFVL